MALQNPNIKKRPDEELGGMGAPMAPAVAGPMASLSAAGSAAQSLYDRVAAAAQDFGERASGKYAPSFADQVRYQVSGEPTAAPAPTPARYTAAGVRPTLARPPAAPAPQQGAATTADPGAKIAGTFNGRTITQDDANTLAAKLPTASGPVVSSGSNYAYATGGTPGQVTTTALNAPINAQSVPAPTLTMPRPLSGDLQGAEKERQQRLGDIDSAMFNLRGNLNSRGRSELYSTLLSQQNQLTRDRIDQVTGLETEGARLANAGAIEQARLGTQVGEGNANRTLRAQEVATDTMLKREAAATAALQPKATLRSQSGATSLLRNDGTLTPLTGTDGRPFREVAADGANITDAMLFDAYRKDIAAINENGLLKPEERAARLAELDARPEYQRVINNLRKPTLHRFLEAAKQANPGASESDLADFYRREYGG